MQSRISTYILILLLLFCSCGTMRVGYYDPIDQQEILSNREKNKKKAYYWVALSVFSFIYYDVHRIRP